MKNRKILIQYLAFNDNKLFEFDDNKIQELPLNTKHEDLLDFIYRQCNVVDGTEWISQRGRGYRSMSVGDVIIILDGIPPRISTFDLGKMTASVYQVEGIGFKKLS
jgi:hypothetical protein